MKLGKIVSAVLTVTFLFSAAGLMAFYVMYWLPNNVYQEAYVFAHDMAENTVITEEDLLVAKKNDLLEGVVTKKSALIGKETKHFVPKNAQIVEAYIDVPDLVIGKDEFTFSLNKSNFIDGDIPPSVRRGDKLYFYAINKREASQDERAGAPRMTYEDIIAKYPNLVDIDALFSATVLYVKDSANREVITTSKEHRYDGSAKINTVEIKVTSEMLQMLYDCIENDQVFAVFYQ